METVAVIPPEKLVFLDECGVNTNLVRTNARSRVGERAPGRRPARRGQNITVVGAISLDQGVHAIRTMMGSMNGPRFCRWLKEALIPKLEPGLTVVLDNLRVHHVNGVRALIEEAGCKVAYLPPYSPDLNPIEMAWSKIKSYLRKRSERTTERVRRAVNWAVRTIALEHVAGWTTRAGYH